MTLSELIRFCRTFAAAPDPDAVLRRLTVRALQRRSTWRRLAPADGIVPRCAPAFDDVRSDLTLLTVRVSTPFHHGKPVVDPAETAELLHVVLGCFDGPGRGRGVWVRPQVPTLTIDQTQLCQQFTVNGWRTAPLPDPRTADRFLTSLMLMLTRLDVAELAPALRERQAARTTALARRWLGSPKANAVRVVRASRGRSSARMPTLSIP